MSDQRAAPPSILASMTKIVSSHLANNAVPVCDVPAFIHSVHTKLSELEGLTHQDVVEEPVDEALRPAVAVVDSVTHEYLVCLEDGKRLRMLRRYLMAQYGMTPEDYRARWNLPHDYPMIAPAVAEQRRLSAQQIGLGQRRTRQAKRPARRTRPAS